MAEEITRPVTRRCAVISGSDRGIGFETCKQLTAEGVVVVLTAIDEKMGRESIEKLRGFGISEDRVLFHQLDVTDLTSVASLVDFIKAKFGKLDILINNAGIGGVVVEGNILVLQELIEKYMSLSNGIEEDAQEMIPSAINGSVTGTYELAEQCLEVNYYGAKRMTEAFIPLLKLSDSPRIVNISSILGRLNLLSNEWAIGMLSDVESLTEERVDEVVNEFLTDFKEGSLQAKNWSLDLSAYKVSKAALSAYTRIISKKYSTLRVNCLCPGYVRTTITGNTGRLSVEEGAANLVKLALLPDYCPSGLFFDQQKVSFF